MSTNLDEDEKVLISSQDAHVDILIKEFKQAGVMPNGYYDITFNEETRRSIWAGQSADGRKWDRNLPEGEEARPWDGCSDTRLMIVDAIVNDGVDLLTAAFRKAELRATTVNSDQLDLVSSISDYLHWLTHTKHRKEWRLESELGAQYVGEYGFTVAYVGWERELGKRRVVFTTDHLTDLLQGLDPKNPETAALQQLPAMIADPTMDDESAEGIRALYRLFVVQSMSGNGFFEDELESEKLLDLKLSLAKKYVKELREKGKTQVPVPIVAKNQAMVRELKPYQDFLAARGTMMLQQARCLFYRRWMTEAEIDEMAADGWDAEWCEEVKKTKGNIASWAGALGATSLTGPSTKTVGNTTFLKVTEENNPLIEVVYGYVKKVDEDGVVDVWETIFSPHLTKKDGVVSLAKGDEDSSQSDFYASHKPLGNAHNLYPFVELKRENIGRALTDTRSVAEIAGTWQLEEKKQHDMLNNRSDWDTLPPVRVPKLGGVDYKLGPGAQVPLSKAQDISAINLEAEPPTLAMELVDRLKLRRSEYFGLFHKDVLPAKLAIRQEKLADDYYTHWSEIYLHVLALTLQYKPQEIVTVTGNQALAQLDPFTVMDQILPGLEFDVKDLNPDYVLQKLKAINEMILPTDVTGAVDRGGLTSYEMRAVDSRLAQRFIQDPRTASQKVFADVQQQVSGMMLGFEAQYVENDPTAPMKLQYLQQLAASNPKVIQWSKTDERFAALLQNYMKNLQMSVSQQQNKMVGRIGVKPVGGGQPSGGPDVQTPMPGNGNPPQAPAGVPM